MPTAEHCLAMADEAERLASIVSYNRDKVRLHEQARGWREQAHAIQLSPVDAASRDADARRGRFWFRRRSA